MYIEKIIIENFKSYRGPIVIGPFHPKYNIIVGRNGSGKSNFFEAIQFVLSEKYQKLAPQEMNELLHKSGSFEARSAFVQINFNNSDKQFLLDEEEFFIRREIGPKKDQYFLNTKKISKEEITSFLEDAGFFKSNPFSIVKQRQLLEIISSSDAMSLKYLEGISGVSLFQSRYPEMKKSLDSTEKYFRQDQSFTRLGKHLEQKEKEEQNMARFLELDKQRCLYEYLLSEQEVKKSSILLEKARDRYLDQSADSIKVQRELNSYNEEISDLQSKLKKIEKEIKSFQLENRELLSEKVKLAMNGRNWKVKIADLTEKIENNEIMQKEFKAELGKLTESINKTEMDLNPMEKKCEATRIREEEITHELAVKKQLQKELNLKKQRKRDFKSREDRDAWIAAQLELLEKDIQDQEASRVECEREFKAEKEKKRDTEVQVMEFKQNLEREAAGIKSYQLELTQREISKLQLQKHRKELFEKKNIFENKLNFLSNELKKTDRIFGMSKNILEGRDSVAKVLEILRQQPDGNEVDEKYFGLLLENFSTSDDLSKAIEATAGSRFFNHVVATDDFGTKILEEMNRNELPGDVTFLPLNRMPPREDPKFPEDENAMPLLQHLKYEDLLDSVMRHIFGRTLLCRNLETAAKMAEKFELNCVTLGGAKISTRGDISGGFKRNYKSAITAQKIRARILEEIRKSEADLKKINAELQDVENEVVANLKTIDKLEIKLQKSTDIRADIRDKIKKLEELLRDLEIKCAEKENFLHEFVTNLEIRRGSKESLEAELEQEFFSQLSGEENEQLEELDGEIEKLTEKKLKLQEEFVSLSEEKHRLQKILKKDLLRKEKIEVSLQELAGNSEKSSAELQVARKEVEEIEKKIEKIDLGVGDGKIKELLEKEEKLGEKIEEVTEKQKEASKKFEEMMNSLNGIKMKMQDYENKIAENKKKSADCGPIRSQNIPKLSTRELNEKLQEVYANLKPFRNLNVQVRGELEKVAQRNEKLMASRERLQKSATAARMLVEAVEERKSQTLLTTLQELNKYFKIIFRIFVQSGAAKLVAKMGREIKNIEDVSIEMIASGKVTGLGFKAAFVEAAELKNVDQFSSGQKSLVALAFIFASQKCCLTPFLILDESDYALDAEYRTGLAAMIRNFSAKAQLISTSFRPEQLEKADEFFGIQFKNKVSYLHKISKTEAKDFVQN